MEDKILNGQFQKIISRRSRKDEAGRDYRCGCGKRYLSYPALYTHIKTKHEGRQPQGTQKSGNNCMVRRTKARISQQTLRQISSLLNKSDLRIFAEFEQGIAGWVALNARIRKQSLPKQMFECYLNLIKHGQFKLTQQESLEYVLTLYLIIIGDYVREKIFEEFLVFARICSDSYAQHGEQVYKAFFQKKDTGPFSISAFTNKQVKYFPIMSQFIVSNYVPEACPNDINSSLLELLIYDFCNWLYLKKATPIKITLSEQYKIDYKVALQMKKLGKGDYLHEMQDKDLRQQNEELFESQSLNEIEQIVQESSNKG